MCSNFFLLIYDGLGVARSFKDYCLKYTFNVARLIRTKYLNPKLFNEIFRVSLFHMQNAKIAVHWNFQERFSHCFKLLPCDNFSISTLQIEIWEGNIITADEIKEWPYNFRWTYGQFYVTLLVPLVTQPMLQCRPNWTEFRFKKSKQQWLSDYLFACLQLPIFYKDMGILAIENMNFETILYQLKN